MSAISMQQALTRTNTIQETPKLDWLSEKEEELFSSAFKKIEGYIKEENLDRLLAFGNLYNKKYRELNTKEKLNHFLVLEKKQLKGLNNIENISNSAISLFSLFYSKSLIHSFKKKLESSYDSSLTAKGNKKLSSFVMGFFSKGKNQQVKEFQEGKPLGMIFV
ncbi:MAG: hypothetical protein AAF443_08370, partial [Chlamydiota bacterium]